VEAGGRGIFPGEHAARFQGGSLGVLQGARTFILQDSNGQIMNTHSISAGLDYAAVGPEHAWLRDLERVEYTFCTDDKALKAFRFLSEKEGIIPALESAHAIAEAMKLAPTLPPEQTILICLSGRGDKDVEQVSRTLGMEKAEAP
jgi:tryptophan synthase beta chain